MPQLGYIDTSSFLAQYFIYTELSKKWHPHAVWMLTSITEYMQCISVYIPNLL
jgi:hypothetical protein